jgi:hypothetical protein
MSKSQGKEVKQTVKGFLSGASKMAPHMRVTHFLVGVLPAVEDGVSCWATSRKRAQVSHWAMSRQRARVSRANQS